MLYPKNKKCHFILRIKKKVMSLLLTTTNMYILQKEYRKDLEMRVKGKGLSGLGLEETPDLLRVKNASLILSEVLFIPQAQLATSLYHR